MRMNRRSNSPDPQVPLQVNTRTLQLIPADMAPPESRIRIPKSRWIEGLFFPDFQEREWE